MQPPDALIHYSALWNERDTARLDGHATRAVSDDVEFIDPANRAKGREALVTMVRETRVAMPDASYLLTSGVDGHNNRYRYSWIVINEGAVAVTGMDVTTLNADGLVERIDGFFGPFPDVGAG
jgi:hypothetical protein